MLAASRMLWWTGFPCGALLFGEPSMLWWLWAVPVPLVIPWLALRAPRPTRFAAMELVSRARSLQPFPQRLIRLAGPLLRAGMLALVVLALARPEFQPSPPASASGPEPHGPVIFCTGGSVGEGGLPPLMAAIRATTSVACRLVRGADPPDDRQRSGPLPDDPDDLDALDGASGIVLCDGAVLDAVDRERVARFVARGGAAVILLGPAALSEPNIAATAALSHRLGGPPLTDSAGLPLPIATDDPVGTTLEVVFGEAGAGEGSRGGAGFADVFLPLEGPRIRRWARIDAGGPAGRSFWGSGAFRGVGAGRGNGPTVIARVRRPTGVESAAVLLRRGAGLVAFVGIPLELPGLADGSWQSSDAAEAWDDLAAWPVFVDVARRVFVPILTGHAAARTAGGEPSSGSLAGVLLLLAIVASGLDPLVRLWGAGGSGR